MYTNVIVPKMQARNFFELRSLKRRFLPINTIYKKIFHCGFKHF